MTDEWLDLLDADPETLLLRFHNRCTNDAQTTWSNMQAARSVVDTAWNSTTKLTHVIKLKSPRAKNDLIKTLTVRLLAFVGSQHYIANLNEPAKQLVFESVKSLAMAQANKSKKNTVNLNFTTHIASVQRRDCPKRS